jgi:hypothetical protein
MPHQPARASPRSRPGCGIALPAPQWLIPRSPNTEPEREALRLAQRDDIRRSLRASATASSARAIAASGQPIPVVPRGVAERRYAVVCAEYTRGLVVRHERLLGVAPRFGCQEWIVVRITGVIRIGVGRSSGRIR